MSAARIWQYWLSQAWWKWALSIHTALSTSMGKVTPDLPFSACTLSKASSSDWSKGLAASTLILQRLINPHFQWNQRTIPPLDVHSASQGLDWLNSSSLASGAHHTTTMHRVPAWCSSSSPSFSFCPWMNVVPTFHACTHTSLTEIHCWSDFA